MGNSELIKEVKKKLAELKSFDDDHCLTCKLYIQTSGEKGKNGFGHCLRFPPVSLNANPRTHALNRVEEHQPVSANNWCAEHSDL